MDTDKNTSMGQFIPSSLVGSLLSKSLQVKKCMLLGTEAHHDRSKAADSFTSSTKSGDDIAETDLYAALTENLDGSRYRVTESTAIGSGEVFTRIFCRSCNCSRISAEVKAEPIPKFQVQQSEDHEPALQTIILWSLAKSKTAGNKSLRGWGPNHLNLQKSVSAPEPNLQEISF
ncbi:unnamed protein product [Vicia faba]|uniref:Uncharacterized protein n=1 Tax=Vicia faba TaxID=3906 RepID=A0AAV0Z508_VICFA|nr:unnamed protein product [Vicia faba]